jgi:hypothetical protein
MAPNDMRMGSTTMALMVPYTTATAQDEEDWCCSMSLSSSMAITGMLVKRGDCSPSELHVDSVGQPLDNFSVPSEYRRGRIRELVKFEIASNSFHSESADEGLAL